MKIIPILAITNALALALAVFLYVQQGEMKSQAGSRRSDSGETARLVARVESLERQLDRANALHGIERAPAEASDAPAHAAPAASTTGAQGGKDAPRLAGRAPEEPEGAAGAGSEDNNPQEMDVFRRKVKKAIEMNNDEDQKVRVIERIDELVKQNKIAPLNPQQKEGVATTVLAYRVKIPLVWQTLRDNGTLESASREDRGRLVRAEYETLRTEAQRSLEEFMPAVDAKTYLDETMRDQMRGGFGGFGGPAPQPPSPPTPGR